MMYTAGMKLPFIPVFQSEEKGESALRSESRKRLRTAGITEPRPLSLKRSVFFRMLLITLAAVLAFYLMGMTINQIGIRNVRNDMQAALQAHAEYTADQLDREIERLKFFMMEMISDKQLLRFAISYDILTDWERLSYVRTLSAQEYQIKRFSDLVDSVMIMFPSFRKTIVTEQSQFADLNTELWSRLLPAAERGKVSITEQDGRLWLLLSRYDGTKPMFLIAFSISPDALSKWLGNLINDKTGDLALLRTDGSVLAACGRGREIRESGSAGSSDRLQADAGLNAVPLRLTGYTFIDSALEPFVLYRTIVWVLTAMALGLLTAYLVFYFRAIIRPVNDLFHSMREVERDTRYRIESSGNSDYDDIYAQFNHMLDHIEHLDAQLYEEKYRAQKAELKQLQIQIDPHFLYNTLYMIYRIAQSEGNRSIASLSLNLSNYYRYITKMPEQIVPLRDEIRHVTNYLEIQRIRFEPRIRVETDELPESIAGEMIPSLIIQPIVENAFQHGVKNLEKDGIVSLRYEVEDSTFRVIVSDNSGEMDEEKVRALWAYVTDPDSPDSSAMCNLYRRLKLYGGNGNELALKCVNGGLTAILTFRRGGSRIENVADCG